MAALNFIITDAGRGLLSNVSTIGPVTITKVAIGSAGYTASASATALTTQIKQITPEGSSVPTAGMIHITASDKSTDAYTVKEIGLYAGTTLFAIYSQTAAILTKASGNVALFSIDLALTNVPAGSVTIGNASFEYPPATETVKGVAEIATTAEAQAGTDDERIVTPKKLQDVTATETRKGVVELATNAETQTGTDTDRAVTPSALSSRTATEIRTGIVELATNAEAQAGTDTVRAITPAALFSAFVKSHGVSGYQKLPNGLILQWGKAGPYTTHGSYPVTFPIAFPTACISMQGFWQFTSATSSGADGDTWPQLVTMTTTGANIYIQNATNTSFYSGSVLWLAIGY